MKKYASRRLVSRSEHGTPLDIKGKNFRFKVEPSISDPSSYRFVQDGFPDNLEVMIYAQNFQQAQVANQLIAAADCLLDGALDFEDINQILVNAVDNADENRQIAECFGFLTPSFSPTTFLHKPGIILACKVAVKASFRRKYIFALHKFFISCRLHCNHWIELDPSHSPNIPLSLFTNDHLRYAYAIMIAYSIIEELGLHVHASSNNPSLLNDGTWNPKVRQNLEKRLLDAGIDTSETILWNMRGKIKTLERRVERRKKIRPVIKAEWACGDVRDCQIDILDAINDLSWIRNTFTAHKVDKDIKKLSIYDVDNAQHLARRLLLETMGFWQVQRTELLKT